MDYNYIDIVFNSSGNPTYINYPEFINQYSTNYILRVYSYIPASKVSASIKTISILPERILFQSTSESINANGVTLKPVYTYQLTQFDTYAYVSNLEITVNVKDLEDTVFNYTLSIPMKKGNYSKVNPNLEEDTTLNSLVKEVDTISRYLAISSATGNPLGSSVTAEANTVVLRDDHGRSKIITPVDSADIANKAYVDSLNSSNIKLPDEIPTSTSVFAVNTSGAQVLISLSDLSNSITSISADSHSSSDNKNYTLQFSSDLDTIIPNVEKIDLHLTDNDNSTTMNITARGISFVYDETSDTRTLTSSIMENEYLQCVYMPLANTTTLSVSLTGTAAPASYNIDSFTLYYRN